jgi:hypothetical protein
MGYGAPDESPKPSVDLNSTIQHIEFKHSIDGSPKNTYPADA